MTNPLARLWGATTGAFKKRGDAGNLWKLLEESQQSKSGAVVNADRALYVSTVFACVRVIAEGVAQVPIVLRRRDATGKVWNDTEDHALYKLMRNPNPWQTGYEFRETLIMHAALCGDGFAFISRIGSNKTPKELIPIEPGRVTISRDESGAPVYKVRAGEGPAIVIPSRDILHLRGPSWDSVRGLEVVALAREAIGLAVASEETHARLHRNGVRLSGVLTTPNALADDVRARIKKAWEEDFSGAQHAGKVAVMEGGLEFRQMAMTSVDAQHLETRRHQIEEICRFFRVYPQMVMHADKTTTFASAEQFFLAHVTHTLGPWIERLAQRLDVALMPERNGDALWLYFDLRGLAPGDAKTRADYWSRLVNGGILTPNEARAGEGFNPIDGGDVLRVPVNLTPATGDNATNNGQ